MAHAALRPGRRPRRAIDGDRDRVKDQPRFEVEDTTTSYSPPRAMRPRWVDRGRMEAPAQTAGAQVTAQHWFDPQGTAQRQGHGPDKPAPPLPPSASREHHSGGPSRRTPLVVGGVAVGLVAAVVGSAVTVGLLATGGWLDDPATHGGGPAIGASQPPVHTLHVGRPDTTRIAAEVGPAVVTVVVGASPGDLVAPPARPTGASTAIASGIVFDQAGWIVTNRHVVCDASLIVVLLADGRRLAARLYGLDSLTDLAVIRVDASGLTAADIGDSASLRPGQPSMVIGGSAASLTTAVTSGVISALGQDLVVTDPCVDGARRALRNVIRIDAAVTTASSGGALVDAAGAVVGVSTSVVGDPQDGASHAIPINIAKPLMEQALEGKPLSRPWMGITYTALTPGIAKAHGLAIDHGAWLRASPDGTLPAVVPGGPADLAGLQEGDILTAIDDQRIDSSHSLDDILSQYRPQDQDPLAVSVLRDGTPIERQLTLGVRSEGL